MKLRTKLLLAIVGPLAAAVAGEGAFATAYEKAALLEGLQEKARSLGSLLVNVAGPSLAMSDVSSVSESLAFVAKDRDFSFAVAFLPDGKAVTAIGSQPAIDSFHLGTFPMAPELREIPGAIVAVVPVTSQGKVYGALALGIAQQATQAKVGRVVLLFGGCALIIAGALAWALSAMMLRPVRAVLGVLEGMAEGDLSHELSVNSKDELGAMATALNVALSQVRETLLEANAMAAQVANASGELASMSDSISAGAQQQSANLEQTAFSITQLTASVRQNAASAEQANRLAKDSLDTAERGREVTISAVSGMQGISESSRRIADITAAIDEIAFHTNLLALNAAVEAARAGDQGRGFAVVASEVRNLSQRSASAAKEIKSLIQDSGHKVDDGVRQVTQSGDTLREIVSSVKKVTDIVGEITATSIEQAAGIEQVNHAVTKMDGVTQQNAAQTEELSATAQQLSDQASQLLGLVARFKLDAVDAASAPARSATAGGTSGARAAANGHSNARMNGRAPGSSAETAAGRLDA